MSTHGRGGRTTIPALRARKGTTPLVCLTAYTAPLARLLDETVDLLLVGDSLGMVLYGRETTLGVSLDTMIAHGKAVVAASRQAAVIVDMPFGSYEESPAQAFHNAARVLAETGAQGVKLEGGQTLAETVAFLVARGIPVLGHVGLRPQAVHQSGGYRAHGRTPDAAEAILADGHAIADAGAFALVVEATVEPVARRLTESVAVPTIGIGASPACDGQILVTEDLLGLSGDHTPRFVHRYAELGAAVRDAAAAYAHDVTARAFPGPEHCFGAPPTGEERS